MTLSFFSSHLLFEIHLQRASLARTFGNTNPWMLCIQNTLLKFHLKHNVTGHIICELHFPCLSYKYCILLHCLLKLNTAKENMKSGWFVFAFRSDLVFWLSVAEDFFLRANTLSNIFHYWPFWFKLSWYMTCFCFLFFQKCRFEPS